MTIKTRDQLFNVTVPNEATHSSGGKILAAHRGALHSVPSDNVRFVVNDAVRHQGFSEFLRFPPANNNPLLDTVNVIKIARLR